MDGLIVMVVWYFFWIVAVGLLQCRLDSCISPVRDIISPETDHVLPVLYRLYSSTNCMSYHSPTHSQPMASVFPCLSRWYFSMSYLLSLLSFIIALPLPLKMPDGPQKAVLGSSYSSCSYPINFASGIRRACVSGKIAVSGRVSMDDNHRAQNNVLKT